MFLRDCFTSSCPLFRTVYIIHLRVGVIRDRKKVREHIFVRTTCMRWYVWPLCANRSWNLNPAKGLARVSMYDGEMFSLEIGYLSEKWRQGIQNALHNSSMNSSRLFPLGLLLSKSSNADVVQPIWVNTSLSLILAQSSSLLRHGRERIAIITRINAQSRLAGHRSNSNIEANGWK